MYPIVGAELGSAYYLAWEVQQVWKLEDNQH
jgi:hypothetical protein